MDAATVDYIYNFFIENKYWFIALIPFAIAVIVLKLRG